MLYIRLAAFLAAQSPAVTTLTLTMAEVEELVGTSLPETARYPSWWRNDPQTMHGRAWLTAGWEVARIDDGAASITWSRVEANQVTV